MPGIYNYQCHLFLKYVNVNHLNHRSLKYGKGTEQSMLIRFLSWLMKINIEFMGEVWKWALHADKAEHVFNPQTPL